MEERVLDTCHWVGHGNDISEQQGVAYLLHSSRLLQDFKVTNKAVTFYARTGSS